VPQHEDQTEEPKLSPGIAFHLMPDGSWSTEKLPHSVLNEAKFSGYLTIQGYRCSVFETPDHSMWAQKSVNTPATASTKKLSGPDMSRKCPECGGKAVDVRAYSACCPNGHFFSVKPAKTASIKPNWVKPELSDEIGELERVSSEEGLNLELLKSSFASADPVALTEEDWYRLENTDSYDVKSLTQANGLANINDRDISSILKGLKSDSPMKMPVILERSDGSITLVGGNTRLMASRASGITPTVLWISISTFDGPVNSMKTLASRVAQAWLSRTADRANDLVSQVNEILEGESDGPFGHDDVEYDADIAKWCEKVVEKMPEMQEIFEEAFHQIMDFKGKLPASDNPRVRQIADEKVSEMMNQAAARLEIISHGLVKEIQDLCTGLAAGAQKMSKEASMKPSELANSLRRIAAAIDNSKSPDRTIVARDLKKVLAAVQINWHAMAGALFIALRQTKFKPNQSYSFDKEQFLDALNSEYGAMVTVHVDQNGELGVQVSFEGDADFVWQGPLASFDDAAKKDAAKKAMKQIQEMMAP